MAREFSRTKMLIGQEGIKRLQNAHVAVFGAGGVGGYVLEALARSGIGTIDIIDHDTVSESNINRQIIALHSTVGRLKVDVWRERIYDINPKCQVNVYPCFYLPEHSSLFDFSKYSYVVDAIDTITAKIDLVVQCKRTHTPLICCLGTGNKFDATQLEITDIYKTSICPLAKVMRRELRARGIENQTVLYSKEMPIKPMKEDRGDIEDKNYIENQDYIKNKKYIENKEWQQKEKREQEEEWKIQKRAVPGSIVFVPATAGMYIASFVVRELLQQ